MTMFPAHLSSSASNYGGGGRYECFISLGGGFSDLMAEDESRTTQTNEETTGSSSKDNIHDEMNTDDDPDRWLQLSLGGAHMHTATHRMPPPPPPPQQLIFQVPEFRGHLPTSTSFFLQPHEAVAAINSVPPTTTLQQQQETNYYNYLPLIRPYPPVSSSSSFSSSSEHANARPLRRLTLTSRMDLRVVNPPRRPHSGFWFMLHASQNQAKEPFLPQIPKSYLRIKDGRMTVGLLIKYLVNKLQLGSESEEKSKSGKRASCI